MSSAVERDRVREFLLQPLPQFDVYPEWRQTCLSFGPDAAIPACIDALREGSDLMQEQESALQCLREHGYRAGYEWHYDVWGEENFVPAEDGDEGYWIQAPGKPGEHIVPRVRPDGLYAGIRRMNVASGLIDPDEKEKL